MTPQPGPASLGLTPLCTSMWLATLGSQGTSQKHTLAGAHPQDARVALSLWQPYSIQLPAAPHTTCGPKLLSRRPTRVGQPPISRCCNVQPLGPGQGPLLTGSDGAQDNLHPVFSHKLVRLGSTVCDRAPHFSGAASGSPGWVHGPPPHLTPTNPTLAPLTPSHPTLPHFTPPHPTLPHLTPPYHTVPHHTPLSEADGCSCRENSRALSPLARFCEELPSNPVTLTLEKSPRSNMHKSTNLKALVKSKLICLCTCITATQINI